MDAHDNHMKREYDSNINIEFSRCRIADSFSLFNYDAKKLTILQYHV